MKRTVTVSGQGAALVVPDRAVVRVSAAHRADGVEEACAGVASAVESIGTVARRFADGSQVASADFSVWPAHDREGRPAGFEARHAVSVTVTDVTEAGRLLTELAREVGDRLRVDGVSLEVGDPVPAQVAAREAAFADARVRAAQLAALGGATLGEVVSVVEGGGSAQPLEPRPQMARAADSEMAFEPGERALATSVTVTWRLR